MRFRASHRYCRMSARKVRRVADLIRRKSYNEASKILAGLPHRGAKFLRKVLDSAMANASHAVLDQDMDLDVDQLLVAEARVDEGPTMKRWRSRARGMALPILKRSCHINIVLEAPEPQAAGVESGE